VPVPSKPVPVPSKPVPPAPHQPVPVPPKPPVHQDRQYVVRSGDTLSEIGVKFSVDWRLIAKRNRITNANRLKVGQRLYIDRTAPVVKHAAPTTYKVVSGDTLSGIASKVNKKYGYKLTWQKLAKLNHISNANHIKVGQVLKLK
jgi:nucleoid-associated protein YgaU